MTQENETTLDTLTREMERVFEERAGYPAGSATDVGSSMRSIRA